MAVITTQLLGKDPNGIKIVELSNWKGHTFVIPRGSLGDLRQQSQLNEPGVYFLIGEGEERPKLYIGQSDNCFGRLTSHDRSREEDEWNIAMVFTGGLHPTYTRYLESVCVRRAKEAGRFEVVNRVDPSEAQLTGAQQETMDEFFEEMEFLTEFFGYHFFKTLQESVVDDRQYFLKADGANASAQLLVDGRLVVLSGSLARMRVTDSFWGWSKEARARFLEDGTLAESGDGISYKYTRDVEFASPSAAAATTMGRPANGWTEWKDASGKTLSENVRK